MRYTWPKFKLCRREGINLFWPAKYDVRKRRKLPWQHWDMMPRLSEYGKLLRNKQTLRRMYLLSEKKFKRLIKEQSFNYSKNKWIAHDKAVVMFLERRLDVIVLRAGLATTIMQSRQMVSHGHFLLNWHKHNIPSYIVDTWDIIEVKEKLKKSNLYSNTPISSGKYKLSSWLNVDKTALKIEVLDLPKPEEIDMPIDVLKVVEYYARV